MVLVVVPTQTPVELSQTVTEYALDDEAFAQTHTLTLTGTLTKSMLHKSLFHGTLTVSGIDGMEQPYMLMLTREDGNGSAFPTRHSPAFPPERTWMNF